MKSLDGAVMSERLYKRNGFCILCASRLARIILKELRCVAVL
jgi:hypothetical protein